MQKRKKINILDYAFERKREKDKAVYDEIDEYLNVLKDLCRIVECINTHINEHKRTGDGVD